MQQTDATKSSTARSRGRAVSWAAAVSLVLWAGWWVCNLSQFQGLAVAPWWAAHLPKLSREDRSHVWLPVMVGGDRTWVPAWQFMGLDYLVYDEAARLHAAGRDLYGPNAVVDSPVPVEWTGTPLYFVLFGWCPWVDRRVGIVLWTGFLAAVAVAASVLAWRCRRALPVVQLPMPVVLAAALWSYPVLFEMERGQTHLLGVLAVVVMVVAMRRRTLAADSLAAVGLAAVSALKLYPLVLVPSLLVLRRGRVAVLAVVAFACIESSTYRQAVASARILHRVESNMDTSLQMYSHSLTAEWRALGVSFPGLILSVMLLTPMAAWVSRAVWRSPRRENLAYPYLLWTCAAVGFLPSVSNDYNLHYLVFAALAAWDARDGLAVQLGMAAMLVWWQPWMPAAGTTPLLNPTAFFLLKLVSLAPVAASLVKRADGDDAGITSRTAFTSPAVVSTS